MGRADGYSPWGERLSQITHTDKNGDSKATYGYTAHGSDDMGFRDYDPGLNRFTTRDVYNGALADMRLRSDPYTGNRYAFTGGNPAS